MGVLLYGFMAHWFLAASPMRRSLSVKATYDGVVRLPWSFAMICAPAHRSCLSAPSAPRHSATKWAVAHLDALVLPVADAGVGGAEVNAHGQPLDLRHGVLACVVCLV